MGVISSAISGAIVSLGKISNFSVNTSAVSPDPSDSSGVLPTFSAAFAGGTDGEYAVGETLTLETPSVGKYEGEIVSASLPSKSNVLGLDANTLLAQLNTDVRVYPLVGSYNITSESVYNPTAAMEYFTQQCGLFYDAVPGVVHAYTSRYIHGGMWARGVTQYISYGNYAIGALPFELLPYRLSGDRWVAPFSVNLDNRFDFPSGQPVNVIVPLTGTEQLTIGGWVLGLSQQLGYVTWVMADASPTPVQVRLRFDTAGGVTLYHSTNGTSWTLIRQAAIPLTQAVHYTVSMHGTSATQTAFTLRLFAEDGSVLWDSVNTVTTNVRGTLRLVSRAVKGEGSVPLVGQGLSSYGEYITTVPNLPVTPPATQKVIEVGYRRGGFPTGWSGNAWEHIKRWGSLYHLDIGYEDGKMTIGPKSREGITMNTVVQADKDIQSRDQARAIEIVNYRHEPTGYVNHVMWAADSVYQIGIAEVQEFLVQTDNSIATVSQPVAVGGISPYPYTEGVGQYVVTGSDGYIVSPAFWRDQGGSITAETTDNEGEIKITIKGPDFQSSRAPYRISEGAADRPALYITGQGVVMNPKTLRVGTGNTKAAKDIGTTFDSTFIGTDKLAYEAASQIAKGYAVPEYTLSLNDSNGYAKPSSLGTSPAGVVVAQEGNNFRVLTATQNPSGVTASAEQSNRIGDYVASFPPGAKISDANVHFAGKNIRNFNVAPLKEVSRERIN